MIQSRKIKVDNPFGEALDVLVEGNESVDSIIIFVHGYGTDKDEGFASFVDLSNAYINEYLILRFDQSGYGASEGADSEFQFQKAAGDLDSMIRCARTQWPDKKINIIAHSLGTFVTSMLSPADIDHIVFTGIPNADSKYVADFLKDRIRSKGGDINLDGVTIYPRSRGGVQKIGKDFWRTLENFDVASRISELAAKTKLAIYRPIQDDVLPPDHFEAYTKMQNIAYHEVDGDHNFTNLDHRALLIEMIRQFLRT